MADATRRVILINEYVSRIKGKQQVDGLTTSQNKLSQSMTLTTAANKKLASSIKTKLINAQLGLNKSNKSLLTSFTKMRWAMVNVAMAGAMAYGAFKLLVQPAIEFEDAMAQVQKTTNFADDDLHDLSMELRQLSTIMPTTAKELAEIAAVAGQLGIDGAESIASFTAAVAMISVATDMTAEQTATNMAKIANAFQIPISEVAYMGNAIDMLENTTAAKASEIERSLTRVGAAATTMGISFEQSSAAVSTLIAAGMGAERSGCYDKETEVLTSNGWKYFRDVDIKKEKIMTINPKTNNIEWQYATKYVEKDWTGKHMIHYKSRDIDLLVTPDHRMWNKLRYGEDYEIISALDLKDKKRFKFQKAGNWGGKSNLDIGASLKSSNNNYDGDVKSLVRLFGHFISEGYLHKHDKTHYSVDITQKENTDTKHLMFKNMSKNFRCLSYKRTMSIHSRQLYNYLKKLGFEGIKSGTKFLPKEWKDLPPILLNELLEGMIDGDGSKKRRNVVWTTSKRLAGDIQEILIKLGRSCNISERPYKGLRQFPNGEYYCDAIMYNVYFKKGSESLYWNERGWGKTTVKEFSGKVYCAVVPNGIMMVRRSGKAVFCGNTRLRKMFQNMSVNAQEFADIAGLTLPEYLKLLETDADEALSMVVKGLNSVTLSSEQVALAVGAAGDVGGFALLTLARNAKEFSDNMGTAEDNMKNFNSLLDSMATKSETVSGQWQILWNTMKEPLLGEKGILADIAEAMRIGQELNRAGVTGIAGLTPEEKRAEFQTIIEAESEQLRKLATESGMTGEAINDMMDAALEPGARLTFQLDRIRNAMTLVEGKSEGGILPKTEDIADIEEAIDEYVDGLEEAGTKQASLTDLTYALRLEINALQRDLRGVGVDLSKVRKEISETNADINNILSRRFKIRGISETDISHIIARQGLELKKAKFAALGLGTAEEFLRNATILTSDEIDSQTESIRKLVEATDDGQTQYDAWKTTLQETIRALLMTSQDIDKDVTTVVRRAQTELLSVTKFDGTKDDQFSAMSNNLDYLGQAQDIFFGDEREQLEHSEKLREDRVNGMNSSAEQAINNLASERSELSKLRQEEEDYISEQEGYKADIDEKRKKIDEITAAYHKQRLELEALKNLEIGETTPLDIASQGMSKRPSYVQMAGSAAVLAEADKHKTSSTSVGSVKIIINGAGKNPYETAIEVGREMSSLPSKI